jgi:DNA-binding NtrC family response regulator
MSDSVLVFVVDDEAAIQNVLQDALEEGGFVVATASSAEQAIAMLNAEGMAYNALVTDVNLGGRLTGWDIATRARELLPDMPVVYMTGGAANEWAAHGVPNSILLTKPFAPAQLITAVSQLLNKASAAPS